MDQPSARLVEIHQRRNTDMVKIMSYRILKSKINDTGVDTDQAIDAAIADLAAQVDAAEGCEPIGGVHTLSRQKPNGLRIWLLQAVREVSRIEPLLARGTLDLPQDAIPKLGLVQLPAEDLVIKDNGIAYLKSESERRSEHVEKNRKVAAAKSALNI